MEEINPNKKALVDYITELLPWAHGHQIKGITAVVEAIIEKQTGNQAELARSFGNQEAGVKRVNRLLHNERLDPRDLADAVLEEAISKLPTGGKVRTTIDWTSEDNQQLLVVSLVFGRRAMPIYWRAYDNSVLKGRTHRYERAVIKRVVKRLRQVVGRKRLRITADRGFADVELFKLLEELGVTFFIRVKGNVKICLWQSWHKLNSMGFAKNARTRNLGHRLYCESSPHHLFITMSRARNRKGKWGIWYLVSNVNCCAKVAATEYGYRFDCEEGFRDAKWWLGFAEARIKEIKAWSRMFALFAITLLVLVHLGLKLLVVSTDSASFLRRVSSRRSDRCELSIISAMTSLLKQDNSLFVHLVNLPVFNLEVTL
jgi:hypothetical protein